MPRIGDLVAGKYKLDRQIGSGGMGIVHAATHTQLGLKVALKLVRDRGDGEDALSSSRLTREARALAQLRSDYVARVFDAGITEDGSFLVMELLEGATAEALVRARGPFSVEEASSCILQVCHALAEAHAQGIVHRDVKPSNLFITDRGRDGVHTKLIDFGIARATTTLAVATRSETKTGALLGSPPFMSPEQITEAKTVDYRTDIWSLGVVLYFLLTGKRPFEGASLLELMTQIAYEAPPPLRSIRPDVPPAMDEIVARCLQKDRERRFTSVLELATELAPMAPPASAAIVERIARGDYGVASGPSLWSVGSDLSTTGRGRNAAAAAIEVTASLNETPNETVGMTLASPTRRRRRRSLVTAGVLAVSLAGVALGVRALPRFASGSITARAEPPAVTASAPPPQTSVAPPVATPPSERAPESTPVSVPMTVSSSARAPANLRPQPHRTRSSPPGAPVRAAKVGNASTSSAPSLLPTTPD